MEKEVQRLCDVWRQSKVNVRIGQEGVVYASAERGTMFSARPHLKSVRVVGYMGQKICAKWKQKGRLEGDNGKSRYEK
jgi:hypothetical protein